MRIYWGWRGEDKTACEMHLPSQDGST